jgi:hypothetical protein
MATYLSRWTVSALGLRSLAFSRAINRTTDLSDDVAGYVRDSLAENTRRAYLSDLAHFEGWGGCIPASDTMIASYLAAHAKTLSVATLVRRLSSISKAHEARGFANPVRHELVKATVRGIRRRRGSIQREANGPPVGVQFLHSIHQPTLTKAVRTNSPSWDHCLRGSLASRALQPRRAQPAR